MKRTDLAALCVWAAASFLATLAVILPQPAGAVSDTASIVRIVHPTLTAKDYTFQVELVPSGDRTAVAFDITARNTTDRPVQASWTLEMQTLARPADSMSRMLARPSSVWSDKGIIALKPGETRHVTVKRAEGVPEARQVMLTLASGKQAFTALQWTSPAQPAIGRAASPSTRASAPRAEVSSR